MMYKHFIARKFTIVKSISRIANGNENFNWLALLG